MKPKRNRIHNWKKLEWPFTISFLYYSLLSFYTGSASGTDGFLRVLFTVLAVDAFVYLCYCYILSPREEDTHKLHLVFFLAYSFLSYDMLSSVFGTFLA